MSEGQQIKFAIRKKRREAVEGKEITKRPLRKLDGWEKKFTGKGRP